MLGAEDLEQLEEEEDFDEALHSSELQGLARALGGKVAEEATAPLPPRRHRRMMDDGQEVTVTATATATAAGGAEGEGAGDGEVVSGAKRPDATEPEAGSKRRRLADLDGDADPAGLAAVMAAAAAAGGDAAAVADAGEAMAAAAAAALGGGEEDGDGDKDGEEEEGEKDNLSDVDDADISMYLATEEEATMREQLWVEMNKDWIEKQEQKKAAAEAAAADQKADGKPKRRYSKKVGLRRGAIWHGTAGSTPCGTSRSGYFLLSVIAVDRRPARELALNC